MKAPVVLLIEDQAMVAEAMKILLLHAGLQLLFASSTLDAIETWNRYKSEIDLVISDFELDTAVTGEELLQHFRADKPNLKSILFSGHPLDTQFGRTQGVDFFEKPFNSGEFVTAAFRLLYG